MILAQDNFKRRGWSKENAPRLDCPLNSITGYGREYFIHEVKQVLESERGRLGYYPPLEDVYHLIERQFGAQLARESRLIGLVDVLNRAGLHYSESVAVEYHEQRAAGQPVLDVRQEFPMPWGTVHDYLMWKLARMVEGDSFQLDCLTFQRMGGCHLLVIGRGVDHVATGRYEAEMIARVLMVLRGVAPVSESVRTKRLRSTLPMIKYKTERTRNRLVGLYYKRGYSATEISAALAVSPDVVWSDLFTAMPSDDMPAPVPAAVSELKQVMHKTLPALPPLPVLTYTRRWEMGAIAERYLEQGYTMAQIQAALVRAD